MNPGGGVDASGNEMPLTRHDRRMTAGEQVEWCVCVKRAGTYAYAAHYSAPGEDQWQGSGRARYARGKQTCQTA